MEIKNILASSSFFIVNKALMLELGIEETIFLGVLVEATEIFQNEWIFQTQQIIEELTGLTRRKQDTIIKNLENKGIIEKKIIGVPAKRYFKINVQKVQSSLYKNAKLECTKTPNYYKERNIKNVDILKEKNNKKESFISKVLSSSVKETLSETRSKERAKQKNKVYGNLDQWKREKNANTP